MKDLDDELKHCCSGLEKTTTRAKLSTKPSIPSGVNSLTSIFMIRYIYTLQLYNYSFKKFTRRQILKNRK